MLLQHPHSAARPSKEQSCHHSGWTAAYNEKVSVVHAVAGHPYKKAANGSVRNGTEADIRRDPCEVGFHLLS
jgi:hypothetical protein